MQRVARFLALILGFTLLAGAAWTQALTQASAQQAAGDAGDIHQRWRASRAWLKQEMETWRRDIKEAGIKLEE
jgi:hypothetical protein